MSLLENISLLVPSEATRRWNVMLRNVASGNVSYSSETWSIRASQNPDFFSFKDKRLGSALHISLLLDNPVLFNILLEAGLPWDKKGPETDTVFVMLERLYKLNQPGSTERSLFFSSAHNDWDPKVEPFPLNWHVEAFLKVQRKIEEQILNQEVGLRELKSKQAARF